MVTLVHATLSMLKAVLGTASPSELSTFKQSGLCLSPDEAIAPRFLIEHAIGQLRQDPDSAFWLALRLVVVERLIVGIGGFKGLPQPDGAIEIGYGIIPSQQSKGFATQAVMLLVQEAFSMAEVEAVLAQTVPKNRASQRVLKKNGFIREGSLFDPEDGELWLWQKTR